MDPIQIINKAVFDIDQELKKDSNPHNENLYMHYLSIISNKMIEKTIDAKVFKIQEIIKTNKILPSQICTIINVGQYTFSLSNSEDKLTIFKSNTETPVLTCIFKVSLHKRNLIKIALENGRYTKEDEIKIAMDLIYNRIECVGTIENYNYICQSFEELDNLYYNLSKNE